MAKISWWKALGVAGLVADELTKAGVDGRVTVDEALVIMGRLAPAVGLKFDNAGSELTMGLLTRLCDAAADGKITITEIIGFAEHICGQLGIEFDKQGVKV